jgi:hypothetical protein
MVTATTFIYPPIDAEACDTVRSVPISPRHQLRLLVDVWIARSGIGALRADARDEPPSPEMSVKSRGLKHYGRRDILAAFGIANNEGHGHQLPSMQIVDRDVASQVPVIEALPRIALNQNNGCFGIVHARTLRTLRSAPANKKNIRGRAASAQLGATRARDQGLSGCSLAKICACPSASFGERPCAPSCGSRQGASAYR